MEGSDRPSVSSHESDLEFKGVLLKTPANIFVDADKLILQFTCKGASPGITKTSHFTRRGRDHSTRCGGLM